MKHEFTREQIVEASESVSRGGTCEPYHAIYLKAFLDALSEPLQDDWQECRSRDLQKNDRFKVEVHNWSYENTVVEVSAEIICHHPLGGAPITANQVDASTHLTLYRIPAPVEESIYLKPHLQPFHLVREEDETGVSGTGIVATGVQFPDGHIAMRWNTGTASTAVYQNIEDVEAIHGHGGKTVVKFVGDDRD